MCHTNVCPAVRSIARAAGGRLHSLPTSASLAKIGRDGANMSLPWSLLASPVIPSAPRPRCWVGPNRHERQRVTVLVDLDAAIAMAPDMVAKAFRNREEQASSQS